MAGEASVGTITGKIELDAASVVATLGEVNTKLDLLSAKMDKGGHSASEIAKGFISAEAVMKAFHVTTDLIGKELEYLVVEGGKAADIREAFDHLTEGANILGDTLLTKVRAGTQGMVDDVDIMKRVNADLAAGLKLTTAQYETIAQASFKLAQAEGIEVKDAFDRVSDAMVTGRTRGIALLTGRIDQDAAEQKYAATLHTTADRLTATEKIEAQRIAILESMAGANARLGESSLNLGDKVQQMEVKFQNFNNELGMAVADSPVFNAGMDAIGHALTEAFGGDKASMVKTVTHIIEEGAIIAVDFGIAMLHMAGGVVEVVGILVGTMQVFLGSLFAIYDFAHGDFQAAKADLVTGFKTISDSVTNNLDVQVALQKVEGGLFAARDAMVAAQAAEELETGAAKNSKKAHEDAAGAAGKHADATDGVTGAVRRSKEEVKAYVEGWEHLNAMGETYQDTLAGVDKGLLDTITYYLKAGASIKDVSSALNVNTSIVEADKKAIDAEAAGYKLLTAAINQHEAAQIGLAQARLANEQSRLKRTLEDDMAALDAKHQRGLISEDAYLKQVLSMRDDYARRSENLYREETNNEEDLISQKLDKELKDLAKEYEQGKIDHQNYEEAKTALTDTAAADRQKIEENYTEAAKQRAHDQQNTVNQSLASQGENVVKLASEWEMLTTAVDKTKEHVKTLSGEVLTLKEYEERQLGGGSSDVTSSNLSEKLNDYQQVTSAGPMGVQSTHPLVGMDESAQKLARMGYSFQEIVDILVNHKAAGTPNGPRIPGFSEGGVGDFGTGTLAMLHGHEAIVPLDKGGANLGGGDTYYFQINGTGADVYRQFRDQQMRDLKASRKFGAA